MNYFYISFANEEKFLGGTIIEADDFKSAIMKSHDRGINPGGEAIGHEIEKPDEFEFMIGEMLNKLCTKEEIEAVDKHYGF